MPTKNKPEDNQEVVVEQASKPPEYQIDLDNLKPQEHFWVDRGLVMSCEGAAHPNHRSFKRRK